MTGTDRMPGWGEARAVHERAPRRARRGRASVGRHPFPDHRCAALGPTAGMGPPAEQARVQIHYETKKAPA